MTALRRDFRRQLTPSMNGDKTQALRTLTPDQVKRIDEALAEVGPFGEVWLVKKGGTLSLMRVLESEAAAYSGDIAS